MSERVNIHDLEPPVVTQLLPEEVLEAGSELLEYFGVDVSPAAEPEKFVTAMDQLNPRFQGKRPLVRFELEEDQTVWPDEAKTIIMGAAKSFRMLAPQTPLEGGFDTVIVLGGARQSNMDRMRYAARCLFTRASLQRETAEGLRQGSLIVAGSERLLPDAEKESVLNYAPLARTEADLLLATVDQIEAVQNGLTREFQSYPQIMSYGASITPGEKVGTPQVIETVLQEMVDWYFEVGREIPKDFRLGAVTTQIYQVSTELDVARVAKQFGITETFTAGNPSDPNIVAKRTPATYYSEALRTLKASALAQAAGVDAVGLSDYPIRPYGVDYYI